MINEIKTRAVKIGGFSHVKGVIIGGESPVVVQTMWKDRLSLSNLSSAADIINSLDILGCRLLRFAVPDMQSAEALGALCESVTMPLAADIHFDYRIALRCMDFPIAKIRINPGNIGGREKIKAVLEKAAKCNVPIRIGVNAGSLPSDLQRRVDDEGMDSAEALVEAAEREMAIFNEFSFTDYLVSMKASTIADNIKANRILSQRTDSPLHIGVTEAGPLTAGVARNTAVILTLLKEGIGDTIRVSLSDSMENEIIAGREILAAVSRLAPENGRMGQNGVNIISCPRCGRHSFDTCDFINRWKDELYAMNKNITAAVMGCEVNGPSEAKHADIGITGAGDKVLIFKHGRIARTITADQADTIFREELRNL